MSDESTRPDPPLDRGELRRRAAGGAALLAGRGALILVVGVGANIALARLLDPRDFGILALGMTLVALGAGLAEGGLGAALIRREEQPSGRELRAVNGLQLAVTLAVALLTLAVAAPFGTDGLVVAAMVAALPVTVLRTPSVIVLERDLRFREIATVDVVEALGFYVVALAAVGAGAGLWGVAGATLLRAAVGTTLMIRLGPIGPVRPRWSWPDVRPLVGFGARMQGVAIASIVRDQLFNAAVAIVAGVAALGIWNLVYRILRVPHTVFATAGRVSYPTMARVIGSGGPVGPVVDRAVATLSLATGAVLITIVAVAPALPAIVGPEWGDVPETLLWAGLALSVGGAVWVIVTSYFFAAGEPGTVLRALLVHSAIWFAIALPLVGTVGIWTIGVGSLAGTVVSGLYLSRRALAHSGAHVVRSVAAPVALSAAGIGVAWWIASSGDASALAVLLGAAAGELLLLGGLALLRRPLLRDTRGLAGDALGDLLGRRHPGAAGGAS